MKISLFILLFLLIFNFDQNSAHACCGPCSGLLNQCDNYCHCASTAETGEPQLVKTTVGHITDEFKKQQKWLVDQFFKEPNAKDGLGILAALKMMTSQLKAIGVQQVQIVGSFFDAKHQLETQRLFQELTARAHKDYHPSEELCEFGTMTRSLASSDSKGRITQAAFSKYATDRQLLAKDMTGTQGSESDRDARLVLFIRDFCNKDDNALNDEPGLDLLCKSGNAKQKNFNRDIQFASALYSPLTLDLDFSQEGTEQTDDEKALFALTANIFAHKIFPFAVEKNFLTGADKPNQNASEILLNSRSVIAKRSIATNSFAAIAALKTKGDDQSKPFLYALIQEMGKGTESSLRVEDIRKMIGDKPSYYAQMEILTKKLYQNPNFYAGLYDKPVNIMRKDVAIQAANLMQKRDLYHSYLRSEMILAVMLEAALQPEQERITNEINPKRGLSQGE